MTLSGEIDKIGCAGWGRTADGNFPVTVVTLARVGRLWN